MMIKDNVLNDFIEKRLNVINDTYSLFFNLNLINEFLRDKKINYYYDIDLGDGERFEDIFKYDKVNVKHFNGYWERRFSAPKEYRIEIYLDVN